VEPPGRCNPVGEDQRRSKRVGWFGRAACGLVRPRPRSPHGRSPSMHLYRSKSVFFQNNGGSPHTQFHRFEEDDFFSREER